MLNLMKKALRLTLTIILCSSFQLNNAYGVENCTVKNQLGKRIAEFTNLIGDEFKVGLPPIGLTADFSRTYLLNEKSVVKISSIYEGPDCIATSFTSNANAKPQSLELNDTNVENWMTDLPSNGRGGVKTYENKVYVKRKLDDLVALIKSPEFKTLKINYQSYDDIPKLSKVNNGGDTWQNPTSVISRVITNQIESDYQKLNDTSKYGDYAGFKTMFLNLGLSSPDGCLRYQTSTDFSKETINIYSSANMGPPHIYYFSEPFTASLSCRVNVSIYGSNFYVGEINLIAVQPKVTVQKTITCVKGKIIKKISAVNPKCPTGYKLRG